jgi:glutamate racemase
MGNDVTLVSSAEETAKDVLRVLTDAELLAEQPQQVRHELMATGPAEPFRRLASRFLGPTLGSFEVATLENA